MAQTPHLQRRNRLAASLHAALLTTVMFFKGQNGDDDRGSESVEKALMTILAVTVGGAVTVGLVALVTSLVNRF